MRSRCCIHFAQQRQHLRVHVNRFKALVKHAQWPDAQQIPSLVLPVSVLAGQLPNADFQVLHACGHQRMLGQPDAVLNAFNTLLAKRL